MRPETSLLHLVHRVSQIGTEKFAAEYPGDLRPRQLIVLRAVEAAPGVSQTSLVEATGIDRSTMSEIAKRLLRRGLLKRRRSKMDARAYTVELTAAGQQVLEDAQPALARVELALLNTVPETDRKRLFATLENIVGAASQEALPTG